MPLMLPRFIDQARQAVARDLLMKTTYWPQVFFTMMALSRFEGAAARRPDHVMARTLSQAVHWPREKHSF